MRIIIKYLSHGWRIIAKNSCFAIFGVGGLCLGYLIIPSIALFTPNKSLRKIRAQMAISITFKYFVLLLQLLGIFKFEFDKIDRLQAETGCLILCNHPTLIDIVVVVSRLKNCNIIVKEALWHNIFIRRIAIWAGYIPNKQASEMLEDVATILKNGQNLLIFPEGTRTNPGQALVLHRGAAQLALRVPAPIRLVKIKCDDSGLAKQDKWYHVPPRAWQPFNVTVEKRIDAQQDYADMPYISRAARYLTADLTKQLDPRII